LTASVALLRLNLTRISSDASHHTSDSVLELTVGGGVDERIDAAVGKLHHNAEVVEPVNDAMLLLQLIRRL